MDTNNGLPSSIDETPAILPSNLSKYLEYGERLGKFLEQQPDGTRRYAIDAKLPGDVGILDHAATFIIDAEGVVRVERHADTGMRIANVRNTLRMTSLAHLKGPRIAS